MARKLQIIALATVATIGITGIVIAQDPALNLQVAFPKKPTEQTKTSPETPEVSSGLSAQSSLASAVTSSQAPVRKISSAVSPVTTDTCQVVVTSPDFTIATSSQDLARAKVNRIQGVAGPRTIELPASSANRASLIEEKFLEDAEFSKLVNVKFQNAPVRKVIDWLTGQGVSFIIEESDLPTNKRISLNAKNIRLGNVLDAVSDALGGTWSRKKDMLVFSGKRSMIFRSTAELPKGSMFIPPFGETIDKEMELQFGKDGEKLQKEMELRFGKNGEKLQKEMELRFGKNGEKLQKEMELRFGKNGEKLQKEMELRFGKNGEKLQKEMENLGKPLGTTLQFKPDGFKKFEGSLTPEQLERHGKQGFLKTSDLSPKQLEMLGLDKSTGKIEISFNFNGKEIKIKS